MGRAARGIGDSRSSQRSLFQNRCGCSVPIRGWGRDWSTSPPAMGQALLMSVELAVSLISGAVAVVSVVLTAVMGAWAARGRLQLQAEIDQQQAARRTYEERQDLMSRIRDPLLWAAFDLQSRLFNIVANDFLPDYFAHGSAAERTYAKRNTFSFSGSTLVGLRSAVARFNSWS